MALYKCDACIAVESPHCVRAAGVVHDWMMVPPQLVFNNPTGTSNALCKCKPYK